MSFDLYFCGSPSTPIDLGRLQQDIGAQEYIRKTWADARLTQFDYKNPETGVRCVFDIRTNTEAEGYELLQDCYSNLGVSVSINFMRPHFFALELMPMISRIANSSGLSIYDPQEDRIYQPETPSETLINAWMEHNQRVTQMMSQGDSPARKPYLSRQESIYWWQYTRGSRALQNRLGQETFVPNLILLTTNRERVIPSVFWSSNMESLVVKNRMNPVPMVFPRCEYLVLSWEDGTKEIRRGIVPYSVALPAMANILDDLDGPVDGLKIIWPEKFEESYDVFERLPTTDYGELKRLALADFIDVEPA